jgi:hypothetical protein
MNEMINIMPKKFNLNEKIPFVQIHWSPKKMALTFVTAGLKRECDILTDNIITGRLGISKDKTNEITLNQTKIEISKLVKRLLEILEEG